jgi:hypothetical protein
MIQHSIVFSIAEDLMLGRAFPAPKASELWSDIHRQFQNLKSLAVFNPTLPSKSQLEKAQFIKCLQLELKTLIWLDYYY